MMACELYNTPCDECSEQCPIDIQEAKDKHLELKETAFNKLNEAKQAMFDYAKNCDVGSERNRAMKINENLFNADRVVL